MLTLEQACALYLDIHHLPTGEPRTDLIAAARIAARWRQIGPEATARIVHALHHAHGMSHRDIERDTGIPRSTAAAMIRLVETGSWPREVR